uniref:Sulfotransferase 4A1 n=1 Tax=Hemiscolopendra marginata TaxID=943146 RepID=A0A646QEP3_9MYRI
MNQSEESKPVEYPEWKEHFRDEPGMHIYGPEGVVLNKGAADQLNAISDFQVRDDDIWVVTFPKSGTTWIQEIVYLIATGCDQKKSQILMDERFPFIESDALYTSSLRNGMNAVTYLEQMESPRFIKSHLPYSYLPQSLLNNKCCKIIYVIRNPKDVLVSFFYFYRMLHSRSFIGEFDAFVKYFMEDKLLCTPYWKHVLSFWNRRHQHNILIIQYENLHRDLVGEAQKIADFLGKTLTEEDTALLTERCCFTSMKENPATNKEYWKDLGRWREGGTEFMRKGEVGDWKNHLSEEMNGELDKWIQKNLSNTTLNLTFELQ